MAHGIARAYQARVLRVDLATGHMSDEVVDPETTRKFVGGTGLGSKFLYDEVPPGVEWNDPENRLIVGSGPLGGTRVMGTGTISIVTKGPMTNGATSTQANGFMGAFMRFNGYDLIVFQGISPKPVYLYLDEGKAELRDAAHLKNLDTWETQDAIAQELGKSARQVSAFSVGPAGENLVRFAAVAGDKGHVAGHNGSGAVMGAKNLKAIASSKGKGRVRVHDAAAVAAIARQMVDDIKNDPVNRRSFDWGTSIGFPGAVARGSLPIKNYTTNLWDAIDPFDGHNYRAANQIKLNPCWACQTHHLHMITLSSGPYAGFVGEEPEYEQWAQWGPVIGNTDPGGAFVLANEVDRLGMENNEAGWVIGWVMECFEKGIFTEEITDGLKMTWGNVEGARAMLRKIAKREGIGNLLAEGVMRASRAIGGEAAKLAIYVEKGNSPRGHDHRSRWFEMFDTAVSNTSTIEAGAAARSQELGMRETDPFDGQEVSTLVAKSKGRMVFEDCLGICRFCSRSDLDIVARAVNAATGWDLTGDDALKTGRRIVNLLRAFNVRHGITPDLEKPSVRYGSVPVDGPTKGRDVGPQWEGMLDNYYSLMGWDRKTGKPLPETLRRYGLLRQIEDLW